MNETNQIIQILLNEGDALKKTELAKILNFELEKINSLIPEIKNILAVLDLKLIENESSLEIALHSEINELLGKQKIEELRSDLSESALQTISVILYRGKATKAEIDFVRGVDSGRSLKNLLTRGLIERLEDKNKKYYIVSTDTLKFLNLESTTEAPDFSEINDKLKGLIDG
jgi:segregation and condensation protein B